MKGVGLYGLYRERLRGVRGRALLEATVSNLPLSQYWISS